MILRVAATILFVSLIAAGSGSVLAYFMNRYAPTFATLFVVLLVMGTAIASILGVVGKIWGQP